MPERQRQESIIAVCGDVHGHLQLSLCAWALEQQLTGARLEAVLLCGDVGTFTAASELDRATLKHRRTNPCEAEFLQWSSSPPPPWLEGIFAPVADGGLALDAPIIVVNGNHEGPECLALVELMAEEIPASPLAVQDLPTLDALGRIRLLGPGWRVRLECGLVVGGIGGIEPGQRLAAGYEPGAYIPEASVAHLRSARELDVLITHQGPARLQGLTAGASSLDPLLDRGSRFVWFHGHARPKPEPARVGHARVVPLGDATFDTHVNGQVPHSGFCRVTLDGDELIPDDYAPQTLADLGRWRWLQTSAGELVAPPLQRFMP